MEYKRHEPDRKVRHIISFTEKEVMAILSDYAQENGQGLPLPPTFIWYPHREDDPDSRSVVIGVDVVKGKENE